MQNKTEEDKTYSFRELFVAYSKFGDVNSNGTSIRLIQSDKWMKTAGLFANETLSLADTLILFADFESESLGYKKYQQFIKHVCHVKKLDFEKVKEQLEKAGLPKITNPKETWDFSMLDSTKRLKNTKTIKKTNTKTKKRKSKDEP